MNDSYHESVKDTAEDIRKRHAAGEWPSEEAYNDAMQQELDETYWSIYWHAAYMCLTESPNEVDAWCELEDIGYELERDNYRQVICVVASIAHRLDVLQAVGELEW